MLGTIARHALRNFTRHCLTIGLLASVLFYGATTQPLADRTHAPAAGSPAALIAEHDCWTGTPPADMVGVIPGHVVVTIDGVTRYAGQRMVGKALDQTFGNKDHGLTVVAFCR